MSSSSSATTSTATGKFYTSNGEIINPDGNTFTANGINVFDSQMGDASQILSDFPGINFVRLNVYSYQSPSAYQSFINTMSAAGVVVEIEDHTNSNGTNAGGSQGSAFTGTQLNNELSWYSSMASAYASNPDVWFGTDNEPPQAGLSTWQQETYNAIRNAGNNNPIMMELPGGGEPGFNVNSYGMTASDYTSMSNIIVDAHFYGWSSNFSTNQQTVDSALTSLAQGAQTITSADGTVPVIIGEYGPSTDGQNTDPNASQVSTAVQTSTAISGSVAWGWDPGANDDLTNGSGGLTSFGQQVAQAIAAQAAASGGSGSTTSAQIPDPNASANDTTVQAGSTAAITDASGNQWTISSGGQVAVNGTADTTTANVTELAYVNGTIWQENSSDLWWGKTSPTASWSPGAGTSTSPLPATTTPPATPTPTAAATPSANDTTVTAGSTAAITDASGNQWTITSGGQVAANGTTDTTTANVTELAYVNGTIWQENASNLWWSKTSPSASWSAGDGTSTSPLPATTTASPNDTMVIAGSASAITDASGNQWTITSGGQVAANGTADTTTANVTELAYVNGTVWQENASDLWWSKTSPTASWSPGNGTSTSPLPAPVTITPDSTSATITQSQISAVATSGTNMIFVNGSNDLVSLSGGTNTITDTGTGNAYILPAAGQGTATFASDILNTGDTLDLKNALAATNWNGSASTLANYLTVADTSSGATVSVAATSGGSATPVATINGASSLNLSTLLAHSIT
jgi:hypothetical protein